MVFAHLRVVRCTRRPKKQSSVATIRDVGVMKGISRLIVGRLITQSNHSLHYEIYLISVQRHKRQLVKEGKKCVLFLSIFILGSNCLSVQR
jgi:hypothetical protein